MNAGGTRTPSFKTALKLEIIYGMPIHQLFPEHYKRYQAQIDEKRRFCSSSLQVNQPEETADGLNSNHVCSAENLLAKAYPSQEDIDAARLHSINLVQKLGDVIKRKKQSDQPEN